MLRDLVKIRKTFPSEKGKIYDSEASRGPPRKVFVVREKDFRLESSSYKVKSKRDGGGIGSGSKDARAPN